MLFGGNGSCLTGEAALVWRRIGHLPREVSAQTIDILVPASRHLKNTAWVRVTRTQRLPVAIAVDDVMTAPMTRAVVDAARWMTSYQTTLAMVSCVINAGRTTLAEVRAEADLASARGCRLLHQVLAEADSGVRSLAEASPRRLFRRHGLPEPLVNEPITLDGQILIPNFRWGTAILEIDSRAWHLLEEGAWERTLARRAKLRAAGYDVLSYTPDQIRDTPEIVLAGVREALAMAAAS